MDMAYQQDTFYVDVVNLKGPHTAVSGWGNNV